MYLIQVLLPLNDAAGRRFEVARHHQVSRELTERYGGLTVYSRSPAHGMWEPQPGQTMHDEVVVYEVMVEKLDTRWWGAYRRLLERRFFQDELVIRAHAIERL